MNIYVGNLDYDTVENTLRSAFEAHGEVSSVNIITDRATGRPRGFGFVEMPSDTEARAAITALNGTVVDGRALAVNEARPREERSGGGDGGNFRGGNSGGGNRGGNSGGSRGGNNRRRF